MNAEVLQYLTNHPDQVDEIKARELEELHVRYPFFAVPLVLLSRYYYQNKDYRYENTLHKCALRVHNRDWLKDFVEQKVPTQSGNFAAKEAEKLVETTTDSKLTELINNNSELISTEENFSQPNPEVVVSEDVSLITTPILEYHKSIADTIVETKTENAQSTDYVSDILEKIGAETEITEKTEIKEQESIEPVTLEQTTEQDNKWLSENSELAQLDALDPRPEEGINTETANAEMQLISSVESEKSTDFSEDTEVFEEIDAFESGNWSSGNYGTDKFETPEIAEENLESLAIEEEIDEPVLKAEPDLEAENFLQHLSFTSPMFEPIMGEDIKELPVNQPVEYAKKPLRLSSLMKGSAYNIEDYFPEENNIVSVEAQANDFFSWLANPLRQHKQAEAKETEERKQQAQDLINRFIANNPQVQRPKSEFFTPQNESKKSEELPEDLATETLASIYAKQGNIPRAILIYEKLSLKFPEKSSYFAALIKKLKEDKS